MLVWPEIIKGIEFAGDDVFVATGEWREGGREGGRAYPACWYGWRLSNDSSSRVTMSL